MNKSHKNTVIFLAALAVVAGLSLAAQAQRIGGDEMGRGRIGGGMGAGMREGGMDGRGQRRGMRDQRDEDREGMRGGPMNDPRRMHQAQALFAMRLGDALRELNLSEDQAAKVREILRKGAEDFRRRRGQRRDDAQDKRQEIDRLREKMSQARRDWDREAFEQAQAEMRELMGGGQGPEGELDALRKQLAEVLTADQMSKLEKMMSPAGAFDRLMGAVGKLDLDNEQAAEVRRIAAETRQRAGEAEQGPQRLRAWHQGARRVVDALDEGQKRRLFEQARNRMQRRHRMTELFQGLNLSEDQRQQIREIVEQESAKARQGEGPADPEAMRETHRRVNRRVVDEVLDEQQAELFRQRLAEMGPRGEGPRGGGRFERDRRGRDDDQRGPGRHRMMPGNMD